MKTRTTNHALTAGITRMSTPQSQCHKKVPSFPDKSNFLAARVGNKKTEGSPYGCPLHTEQVTRYDLVRLLHRFVVEFVSVDLLEVHSLYPCLFATWPGFGSIYRVRSYQGGNVVAELSQV